MHTPHGPSASSSRTTTKIPGQMTLGEAIALVRGQGTALQGPAVGVDRDAAVRALQAVHVCAVCGWTERAHTGSLFPETCGSYCP